MLTEICQELKNWFVTSSNDIIHGKFTIVSGVIAPPIPAKTRQYIRIVGSTFNDGVYQYPYYDLEDEEFDGSIWLMRVPKEVIALSDEIESYMANYGSPSPYTSESFGEYSYSRAVNSDNTPMSWQKAFASRLNAWRKII